MRGGDEGKRGVGKGEIVTNVLLIKVLTATLTKYGGTSIAGGRERGPIVALNDSDCPPCGCLGRSKVPAKVSIRLTARTFEEVKCRISIIRVG